LLLHELETTEKQRRYSVLNFMTPTNELLNKQSHISCVCVVMHQYGDGANLWGYVC